MSTTASGILLGGDHGAPFGKIGRRGIQAQFVDHDVIEILLVQQHRDFVNIVGIHRRNHRPFFDIGEQGNLAALLIGKALRATAQ